VASLHKILGLVLGGRSDANIRFDDIRRLLTRMGFSERIKSSHHIFHRDDVEEILNLQPLPGGKAKPYQVRQVRNLVLKYALEID
jgi:hypothetical protein